MKDALLDKEVDAILLDTYTAGEYSEMLDHPLLLIKEIIQVQALIKCQLLLMPLYHFLDFNFLNSMLL